MFHFWRSFKQSKGSWCFFFWRSFEGSRRLWCNGFEMVFKNLEGPSDSILEKF